jgi:hypothetical protein
VAGTKGRSGGARRNAGRPSKSLEEHERQGTYRADRHGHLAIIEGSSARVVEPRATATPTDQPTIEALGDGLGPDGKLFLSAALRDFEHSSTEGYVLRIAAQAFDDSQRARAVGNLKASQAAARLFLATLQRLGWPTLESL